MARGDIVSRHAADVSRRRNIASRERYSGHPGAGFRRRAMWRGRGGWSELFIAVWDADDVWHHGTRRSLPAGLFLDRAARAGSLDTLMADAK
jgi:hypothetical protein